MGNRERVQMNNLYQKFQFWQGKVFQMVAWMSILNELPDSLLGLGETKRIEPQPQGSNRTIGQLDKQQNSQKI